MKYFRFILISAFLVSNAFGQTQGSNKTEELGNDNHNNNKNFNVHVLISQPDTHVWGGIQLGWYLTKHFELIGIMDIMIADQLLCDHLLQANIAYNINLYKTIDAFTFAGIGDHSCREAGSSTPMVNLGTGLQTNTKPAIRLEYRSHIKFNKQGTGDITHDNLHVISLGISF